MNPDVNRDPVSSLTDKKYVASRVLKVRLRCGNLVDVHGKEHLEYVLSPQVFFIYFRVNRKHG
jgi:hypothetical protein